MKHTKGPWEVGVVRDNGSRIITAQGPLYIATLWPWVGWPDNDEIAANAQLMAAAPELLEALISLLNARDIRQRISLWPQRFRQIKIKGSASRRRFERHYAAAIMKIIKAEEQAHAAIAKAKG